MLTMRREKAGISPPFSSPFRPPVSENEADADGETELQASRVADLGLESERELKEGLRPLLAAAAAAPTASGEPEAEVGNKRPREE